MPGISWVAAILLYSLYVMTVLLIMLEAWRKQAQYDHFLQLLEQIEVALRLRLKHNVQRTAAYRLFIVGFVRRRHYEIADLFMLLPLAVLSGI